MFGDVFFTNSTRGKSPLNSPPFWGEDFFLNGFPSASKSGKSKVCGGFPSSLQGFVVKGPPLEVKFYLSFSLIFIASSFGEYVYQYLAGGFFSGKAGRELPEPSASGVI